jgi:hypothetical protein
MVKKCVSCSTNNVDESNYCYNCGTSFQIKVKKPQSKSILTTIPTLPLSYPVVHPIVTRTINPGMCYYHNVLPARYICTRCGKQVCSNCALNYFGLVLCPPCQRQMIFFPYSPLALSFLL